MKLNSRTVGLLCVVSFLAVALGSSQQAIAADLACCHETTLECVGGYGSPQFCPASCPLGYWICDSEIGPCQQDSVKCQVGCDCYVGIDSACCEVLGGDVVSFCLFCPPKDWHDAPDAENQEDDSPVPDEQPEEESDAPSPISKAWVLALPLFLLVPVVPVMLRRRPKM